MKWFLLKVFRLLLGHETHYQAYFCFFFAQIQFIINLKNKLLNLFNMHYNRGGFLSKYTIPMKIPIPGIKIPGISRKNPIPKPTLITIRPGSRPDNNMIVHSDIQYMVPLLAMRSFKKRWLCSGSSELRKVGKIEIRDF